MRAPRREGWDRSPAKIVMSHMNAASPRQSLVKGERLTRYELAAVMATDERVLMVVALCTPRTSGWIGAVRRYEQPRAWYAGGDDDGNWW